MLEGAPLAMAAGHGHPEIVAQLIAAHAFVNQGGITGITALMAAAQDGDNKIEIVRLLIDARADVNQERVFHSGPDTDGSAVGDETRGITALHMAALGLQLETARQLIAAGENVNHLGGPSFGAPLHQAISGCMTDPRRKLCVFDLAKLLLEAGADVNQPISPGQKNTPVMIAMLSGNTKLLKLFQKHGAMMDADVLSVPDEMVSIFNSTHAERSRMVEFIAKRRKDCQAEVE